MNQVGEKMPGRISVYIVVLFLITLFIRAVLIGYYNNNLGGIEPNVIYGIQRLLLGQPLYQSTISDTYAIIQYTPLWYYVVAGVAKLISPTHYQRGLDVQGIYELCRILALLFNMFTVVVIAALIRTFRFSWAQSFLLSLPLLIVLTNHYYTRGDSLQLFLFVAAFYLYLLYSKKGSLLYLPIAALCSAACIMTKQSGILCIGIIAFCLVFIERKYLAAAIYTICSLIFTWALISLLAEDWSTFYQNTLLGLKNGIDLSFLYQIFISQYFMDLVPFYVLGAIVVWLATRQIADKTFGILAAGASLSFLFAMATGLKVGSSNNYLTEFLVFVLLSLPLLLQHEEGRKVLLRFFGRTLTIHGFAWIAFFILVTSKTVGFFSVVYIEKGLKNYKDEYANEQMLYSYCKNSLQIKDGEKIFFTERKFLDNLFIEYSIMPIKDIVTQIYTANPTTYNYARFTSGMNTGMIRYIVTDEKRDDINVCNDSLPFVLFDKSKFRLLSKVSGYCIYQFAD
jgi:hypothetical protein